MALCVMNPIDQNPKKIDNFSLKLLGIGRFDLTDEEILESISNYIDPRYIEGLLFDHYNNYYVLFLNNIDATCRLVGKKVRTASYCINIYPLLECYLIDNVYPCLKNEELCDIFRTFGNVFSVTNHLLAPNSSKFSHVLSGKREITFLLPGEELEIYIPLNVVHPPYTFNVRKFCCACLTEGHSLLYCPDIEDDKNVPELSMNNKHETSDSDGELEALIKSEDINFDETKLEDSLPETQPTDETLKQRCEPETPKVNLEKDDEFKQDEAIKDVPPEEKHLNKRAKIDNTNNLTEVVSTSKVCRFTPGMEVPARHFVKRTVVLLPPLAADLISEVCGPLILEANVFKQLVLTDGRLKTEIIKFSYSYLEDISNLLKVLKKVVKRCYKDKTYASLRGPFTSKVKRIHAVLSDFVKKK